MKKTFIILIVVVLVGITGFYALNSYIYNEKQADFIVGDTAEISGKIIALDFEQITFDGPYVLTVESEDGKAVNVRVPSMGLAFCNAYKNKNIGEVSLFKVGDEVEVRGTINEDGSVVPCDESDHYLRPTPLLVEDFEGEADPSKMTLGMKTWVWQSALYNDEREIRPKVEKQFSITFGNDGKFSATTDCNSMGGSYKVEGEKITFSQIFSTKMFCEGSQESEFASLLETASSFHFTSKGELILDLKFDSGSAIFR